MALVHYTAPVTAAAQNLATALGLTPQQDVPFEFMVLQGGAANANPVFIGGPGVTTTDYGFRIAGLASSQPDTSLRMPAIPRGVRPSEIYFVGTAGEELQVLGIPL